MRSLIVLIFLFGAMAVFGQTDHSGHKMAPTPTPTPTPMDHSHHQMTPDVKADEPKPDNEHAGHQMDTGEMTMSSTVDIGDPMNREGSVTSWLPDSSPMYAYMKHYKDGGMLMLMGTAFLRYTQIGSDRDVSVAGRGGRSRFDAPNMFMAMYSRPLSKRTQLGLRAMASIDPITQRGYGYP